MSFRENVQHLRAAHRMTQEQLAMLLGVSRQSVTKWESGKSNPEMDKLLKICEIFGCTLDDLVCGDLTSRPAEPTVAMPDAAPADVCGYDEERRSFARSVSTAVGVRVIVLGGMLWVGMDVWAYISANAGAEADGALGPRSRRDRVTGGLCGAVMLVATLVGLVMLFVPGYQTPLFWLAWPIGGITCGVVSCLTSAFVADE